MKIIRRTVYTMYQGKNEELVAENISEYYGKLIVHSMNSTGEGREWKLFLVDDNYVCK